MSSPAPPARLKLVAALFAFLATVLIGPPASAQFDSDDVIRLNRSNPIITANMFPSNRRGSDGNNINGACMIRIPDFISRDRRANRSANYYLYFGHHQGDYIRMAWSVNAAGPFTLYRAGAGVGTRGVMDNNNTNISLSNNIQIRRNHIASPDVHVDEANRQIIMYFHSGSPYRFNGRDTSEQVTWVNTSSDGLNFRRRDTRPVQLGPSYFRVFEDNRTLYAFHNNGGPVRARSFNNPWEPTRGYYDGRSLPDLWEARGRNMFRDAFERGVRPARPPLGHPRQRPERPGLLHHPRRQPRAHLRFQHQPQHALVGRLVHPHPRHRDPARRRRLGRRPPHTPPLRGRRRGRRQPAARPLHL